VGYHLLAGRDELLDSLANQIYAREAESVVLAPSGLVEELKVPAGLAERLSGVTIHVVDETRLPDAAVEPFHPMWTAAVGITSCQALLAQTGTMVLAEGSAARLAVSLVPRAHFCLGRLDSLFPDAETWAAAGGFLPGAHQVLLAGPSRTADIEKQVVVGVHGPWRVSLFLLR